MSSQTSNEVGKSPLRTIIARLLRERRVRMFGLATTSAIGGLVEAAFLLAITQTAFAITDGTDEVELLGRSWSTTLALAGSLVLIVVRVVLAVWANWQGATLASSVSADMRCELATAFLRSSYAVQNRNRTGRLQELLTTFAGSGAVLLTGIVSAVSAGFSLGALLLSAIIVSPVASIVIVLVISLLSLVLRPIRRAVRTSASKTASTGMNVATSLSEISDLGMEMHVFNVQPQVNEVVVGLVRRSEVATRRMSIIQGLLATVYSGLSYVAIVIGLGVLSVFSTTSMSAVGAAMLVMLRSLGYGQRIQTASANIHGSLPYLDDLQRELDLYRDAERQDHGVPIGHVGEIELHEVSFGYNAGVPVLTGINAVIPATSVIGVIGPSGSGKSTLVQLLLALRAPTSGKITSAGRNIDDLSQAEWARKVTFVPQTAHLIEGTVAENIRFFRDNVSDEEIVRASKLAHLHEDVERFGDGYQRQVGGRGGRLSGGQQQRLIIARALVERPELLILDEPTSSLDVRSEELIRQTLETLRDHTTIIIIAHRLSTLNICDRLMVIQDGELKAFDTPTQLEQTSEFYREALVLSGLR